MAILVWSIQAKKVAGMWNQGMSIKIALAKSGKKQNQIAEIAGVSIARLSHYKHGKLGFSVPVAERLAKAFEMQLSEFVKLGE